MEQGETARFRRGATEEMYRRYLEEIYLPAMDIRGMIPIFVTPMTRVNKEVADDGTFYNSFSNRKFPDVMKEVAVELYGLTQRFETLKVLESTFKKEVKIITSLF